MNLKESIASKKFWFAVMAVIVGFIYAVLGASKLKEMQGMYSTFTGLVEFVVAAYLTGNVANKVALGWASKKGPKKAKPVDAPPEAPVEPPEAPADKPNMLPNKKPKP